MYSYEPFERFSEVDSKALMTNQNFLQLNVHPSCFSRITFGTVNLHGGQQCTQVVKYTTGVPQNEKLAESVLEVHVGQMQILLKLFLTDPAISNY